MAERGRNSGEDGDEIKTLKVALIQLGEPYLLHDLDKSLLLVRRHKKTKDEHLQFLKSVNKRLLKLSMSYHPDRIIETDDKPDKEFAKAQRLQAALNACRAVLLTLTENFLEYIDIDYKYDFFSELNINILISDEERSLLFGKLSSSLRRLMEMKQDVVTGEVRKFLLKSRKCIKSFLEHDKSNFQRYRDHAVHHLEKCVEGYKTLTSEGSCLEKTRTCSYVKFVIQKAAQQNALESNILSDLLSVTRRSLRGPFLIFSIRGPTDGFEYFILPFVYYIFILLMCTLIADRRIYIKGKNYSIEAPYYEKEPDMFFTAYYLACYFNDKNLCSEEVELILSKIKLPKTENNVVKTFHDNLKKIDCFLAEEFKIDLYDAGKTCGEQFNDKLTRFNEATAEFENKINDLLEKVSACKVEYEEIKRDHLNKQ